MGEDIFNQFLRLMKQLVIAAGTFAREKNLSPMMLPTRSRHLNEHLKLANKLVDVVDRATKKICVNLLRYNVENPENSFAQFLQYARKKQDKSFQQIGYVN